MTREKKTIEIKLIIGILFLLILLIGASYAYFVVGTNTSEYNRTVITGSTEGTSIASIQNPIDKLNLNIDGAAMSLDNLGTIYADDEENYVKTKSEGFHDIGIITLTNAKKDDNIYRCTANVTITVDNGANSILNFLQEGDLKIFLRWGTHNQVIDLSTIKETGKTTTPISLDIVGNNSKSIETYIEFTNRDEDQSYLSEKDINIDIDATDLKCELTGEKAVYFEVNGSPLKEEENKNNIKKIYFVNYIDTSNAAFEAKDYTRVGTGNLQSPAGSIIGWLEEIPKETDEEEQYYDLYIGSKARIYSVSSEYSSFYLNFANVETINYDNFYSDFITKTYRMYGGEIKLANYSTWETDNNFDMEAMFSGSKALKLDVSNFNTKNVTVMSHMFSGLNQIKELDVSNFNTCKVTHMVSMFKRMSSLTELDVSNFYTGNVTDMSGMFFGLKLITKLDLSKFNTSKVINTSDMFLNMSSLEYLDLRNAEFSQVTEYINMFYGVKNGITIIVKDEENRDWIEARLKEVNITGNVLLPNEIESQ